MLNLSSDVLNNKLLNIFKSILKLDKLNLLHTKSFIDFSKRIKVYQSNVLLKIMFPHINHITVFLHNHLFTIRVLPRDKNLLHVILERKLTNLLRFVLNLSNQTRVSFFFTTHITQNITRPLLLLHNYNSNNFEISHAHLFHLPW